MPACATEFSVIVLYILLLYFLIILDVFLKGGSWIVKHSLCTCIFIWDCTEGGAFKISLIIRFMKIFYKLIKVCGQHCKCPEVWRPCLYMYLSLALSLDISVGMFNWYSNPTAGPAFSESFIGHIYSVGSIGSLLGVLLYQSKLKDHPFWRVFLWAQILTSMSDMLDLLFLLRLNQNLHIPDHFSSVIDSGISAFVMNLKWMLLSILSYKLCPPRVAGMFFALLMSIDNAGFLTLSWVGGLLLHFLKVTRDEFGNLWIAVLILNFSRLLPLGFLFLILMSDHNLALIHSDI